MEALQALQILEEAPQVYNAAARLRSLLVARWTARLEAFFFGVYRFHGPAGVFAKTVRNTSRRACAKRTILG